MFQSSGLSAPHIPWNKGKLIGQRPPLKKQEIWSIRVRLELSQKARDLALFNLAIDSKLRGCDLVKLRIRDISTGNSISNRAMVMQQKTHQPVQFEITEQTRNSLKRWLNQTNLKVDDYLFPNRCQSSTHITTRQYARLVKNWELKLRSFTKKPRTFELFKYYWDIQSLKVQLGIWESKLMTLLKCLKT
jgi:integrase